MKSIDFSFQKHKKAIAECWVKQGHQMTFKGGIVKELMERRARRRHRESLF